LVSEVAVNQQLTPAHHAPELLWQPDDPDVQRVQVAFVENIRRVAPAMTDAGRDLLARLSRPNWTMEWYLPRWLGDALGLPEEAQRNLMQSNIFGLAYVRVQDDLTDGDAEEQSTAVLPALAAALYLLWMDEYRSSFGSQADFWDRFDAYMGQWIAATLASSTGTDQPHPLSVGGRQTLAQRGAPLKICCAGACLLAKRARLIPQVEAAVDHLLAGAVLLDHMHDWNSDLASGRYNAFVAYASELPQDTAHQDANRKRVREAIYIRDAARPYFAAIREEIRAADWAAQSIPCPGLSAFLAWLDEETRRASENLARNAQAQIETVMGLLFGESPTGATVEGSYADGQHY